MTMQVNDQPVYKPVPGYRCLVIGYESRPLAGLSHTLMECPFCLEVGVYIIPHPTKEKRYTGCYCPHCDISYRWEKENRNETQANF